MKTIAAILTLLALSACQSRKMGTIEEGEPPYEYPIPVK